MSTEFCRSERLKQRQSDYAVMSSRSTSSPPGGSDFGSYENYGPSRMQKSSNFPLPAPITKHQKRKRSHSKWKLAWKLFSLSFAALMPIYVPVIVKNIIGLSGAVENSEITLEADSPTMKPHVIVNNYHYDQNKQLSLINFQESVNMALNHHLKESYQNRRHYMNMALDKAGAKIYMLYCSGSKRAEDTVVTSLLPNQISFNANCRDPHSLIQDKSEKNRWYYVGRLSIVHIEFNERIRIYAVGMEVSKWEFKNMMKDTTRIVAVGIDHYNGKDPWDDVQNYQGIIEQKELMSVLVDEWEEKEEIAEKVRLFFECKSQVCANSFRGIKFEIQNSGTSNTLHYIERFIVFDKF